MSTGDGDLAGLLDLALHRGGLGLRIRRGARGRRVGHRAARRRRRHRRDDERRPARQQHRGQRPHRNLGRRVLRRRAGVRAPTAQLPAGATDVQFRYSTDAAYLDTGWFVDDVMVNGAAATVSSDAGEWFETTGIQDNNWTLQVVSSLRPHAGRRLRVRDHGRRGQLRLPAHGRPDQPGRVQHQVRERHQGRLRHPGLEPADG